MRDNQPVSRTNFSAILKEPLLHFILIGGLLFLFTFLRTGGTADSGKEIHVSAAQQEVLRAGFERDSGRLPDPEEMQGLVDDYVRTEVCNREARALGLDQGDQLIRDHLRSKYEMLLDDGSVAPEPNEEQLQQFLEEHPERYRTEDAVRFMQIFLDPQKREVETQLDAQLLLQQLTGEESLGTVQALSDPGPLPASLPLLALSEVGWQFDQDFAAALAAMEPGRWSGPLVSSYGLHLVFVQEHLPGRPLELTEIREDVERDWIYAELQERLDEQLAAVLQKYEITVDELPETAGTQSQAADDTGETRP